MSTSRQSIEGGGGKSVSDIGNSISKGTEAEGTSRAQAPANPSGRWKGKVCVGKWWERWLER